MANTRKPSPTRKPATRKPAAKSATTRSKAAPAAPEQVTEQVTANPRSLRDVPEEERTAKLTAFNALRSAGLEIPEDLRNEVEGWIAEEDIRRAKEQEERDKAQAALDEENKKGPWWVRNGYRAPFSLRLDRQTERRRIELKGRGQPGDMYPLEEGDLDDVNLRRNLQIGIIEVIPAGEARRIMEHQTHNAERRVHTPLAILRRPDGKAYDEGSFKVEAEYNSQGVTVGVIDPAQMQGHVPDKQIGWGGVARVNPGEPQPREIASGFVPTGGNPAIIQSGPLPSMDRDAQARIADDIARRRGVQGRPEDVMGLRVVVDPVQREG